MLLMFFYLLCLTCLKSHFLVVAESPSANARPWSAPLLLLTPVWVPDFVVVPDTMGVLRFSVSASGVVAAGDEMADTKSGNFSSLITWTFTAKDYAGTVAAPVTTTAVNATFVSVTVLFPQGYYDVTCTQTNQTWGVIALPSVPAVDQRWGLLAGLTQVRIVRYAATHRHARTHTHTHTESATHPTCACACLQRYKYVTICTHATKHMHTWRHVDVLARAHTPTPTYTLVRVGTRARLSHTPAPAAHALASPEVHSHFL